MSRRHATISFNFTTRSFELAVLGKGAITVSGQEITAATPPRPLASGDLLEAADWSLHFFLPREPAMLADQNGSNGANAASAAPAMVSPAVVGAATAGHAVVAPPLQPNAAAQILPDALRTALQARPLPIVAASSFSLFLPLPPSLPLSPSLSFSLPLFPSLFLSLSSLEE